MPLSYIPKDKKNRSKKKVRFGGMPAYDSQARNEKSAANQLSDLQSQGLLDEFTAYREDKTSLGSAAWSALKKGGSSALDLVSRAGYATGGAMEEAFQGTPENIPGRVGSELFSGIGRLKGQKELPSDVLRQETNYGQFSEEHPIASMATDLATNIVLDPSTYTGGAAIKGIGKALSAGGKGIVKAARTTKTGEQVIDKLGRSFVPRYGLKRGVEKLTGNSKAAELIDDIYYNRELEKRFLEGKYAGKAKEIITATKGMAPEQISAIEKALMEGGIDGLDDTLKPIAEKYRALTREQYGDYAENLMAVGKTPTAARIDYLHNNPRGYTDLMDEAGDLEHTGLNRGLVDKKQGFEKQKVLNTFDELQEFKDRTGIKPEDYWQVFQRNVADLPRQNVQRIFQVRVQDDLLKGMESVGAARKLPAGTRTVWAIAPEAKEGAESVVREVDEFGLAPGMRIIAKDRGNIGTITKIDGDQYTVHFFNRQAGTQANKVFSRDMLEQQFKTRTIDQFEPGKTFLKKGETLYMPAGNLRFFGQDVVGKEALQDVIDNGGVITQEMLDELVKSVPGFTTRVPVYAIPTESAKFLLDASRRLGSPDTVASWWDKLMGTFKNTAILSPGFLTRNAISSGFTNYLADGFGKSLAGYRDYLTVLNAADDTRKIGKYTIKELREDILPRYGITGGGFVGQQVGEATGKISSKIEPVFRWWRDVNASQESAHRGAMFINAIRDGADPLKAAQKVKKFHFDYRDLTNFEQGVKQKLVPFYAWTRNNLPLQIEMLFKAPTKYRNLNYIKEAVAGGQIDPNAPDWWEQQDVWQTKMKDKQGNPLAVSMGLPYADLNLLNGNPAGMLGPASALMNTANNYDAFLQRPIQEFKGQKKPILTAGNIEIDQMPGLNNPKVLYALQGLAPILKRYGTDLSAEVSRILTGKEKPDDKYRAVAKIIGVRVLPNIKGEAEKRKVLELLNDLREFNKYQEQEAR